MEYLAYVTFGVLKGSLKHLSSFVQPSAIANMNIYERRTLLKIDTYRVAKTFLKKSVHFQNQSVQSVHLLGKNPFNPYISFFKNPYNPYKFLIKSVQFLKKIRTNRLFRKKCNYFWKKHIKIQLFMCEGLNFFSRRGTLRFDLSVP